MLDRSTNDSNNIINYLVAMPDEKSVRAAAEQYDLEQLDAINKNLFLLRKAERKKLRPIEDRILAQCDETVLRSTLREVLFYGKNNSEDIENLLKHSRRENKSANDAETCTRQENEIKELANQYIKMAQALIRFEKLQDIIGSFFEIQQGNYYYYYDKKKKMTLDVALHSAIESGRLDGVRALVKQGANIHATDEFKHTALHIAVKYDHYDIVRFLVHRGAKIDAKSVQGNTPLHYAMSCGVASYLLRHNANVNALNYKNQSPLQSVLLDDIRLNDDERLSDVAALLIERGANVNQKNHIGGSPFYIATLTGAKDIMSLLASKSAKVNAKCSWYKHTALHRAVKDKNLDIVRHVVSLGGDLSAKNQYGETPLNMWACTYSVEMKDYLLNADREQQKTRQKGAVSITAPVGTLFQPAAASFVAETVTRERLKTGK